MAPAGLTAAEVQERVARGQTNDTGERTSRTLGEIFRANVFTRFNAILGAALVVIVIIGPIQDATFAVVLVANSAIGIFQEVRAKRTLDQLAVANAPAARVVRDGDRRGDRGRGRGARRPARAPRPATRSRATASCTPASTGSRSTSRS